MIATLSLVLSCVSNVPQVANVQKAAEAEGERKGVTFFVSKLGEDTDGLSWRTAFRTVQGALNSIPDDEGGHQIIIRPDTYMEDNLFSTHKGAKGAYNLLVGDVDGALGSGRTGHVVIDAGDPRKGFKSYDWWGTIRAYKKGWSEEHKAETFSAIDWDRWILRNLYVTGGDGGFMFDCVDKIEPFTVIVEDCVSIGRAFGGGVASCLSRQDEPIVFRRCHLWALDWWGDSSAAYVRVENETMPEGHDILFEDCSMVSPQCALKVGNYGFTTSSHVKVSNCRLIVLNFSQPHGTPTNGIIQSVEQGKFMSVDLEDSTLMGYKVFGVTVNKDTEKDIQYTTEGSVLAYVQFQQDVPQGMHPLGQWPVDVFSQLIPPSPEPAGPALVEDDFLEKDLCELSPFIWRGKLCHMDCVRPGRGGERSDYYLRITDASSGEELARFAEGHGLASILVHEDELYAFASRWDGGSWNDVTLFHSADGASWTSRVVVEQEKENIFNSSVCQGPDGFAMAYETSDSTYPAFTVKFATSTDLTTWTKRPEAIFGTDRYTACPCLRYAEGHYYMLYLENRSPRHYFETYIARSNDLVNWELSTANPVLEPKGLDDGINASDPELVELAGKTYIYYAVGDQLTWMNIKRAIYGGTMTDFLKNWF